MSLLPIIGFGGMGLSLAALCAIPLTGQLRQQRRLRERFAAVRAMGQEAAPAATKKGERRLWEAVADFGSLIARSGLLSARTLNELEGTLQSGGFRGGNGLGLFIGSKILLIMLLPALAAVALRPMHLRSILYLGLVAASAVAGLLGPDMAVRNIRSKHLKAVENGLADGLDMMVICAEAGLALEPAIRRVSVEIMHAHPKLADELVITSKELNLLADSRIALINMGTRTGLSSLKRLGSTLVQTIQYGTPLGIALRTLATELRQETLTRYEERAARLPVLLTVPMILFILPCVFLVVAGPVAVQVLKMMKH